MPLACCAIKLSIAFGFASTTLVTPFGVSYNVGRVTALSGSENLTALGVLLANSGLIVVTMITMSRVVVIAGSHSSVTKRSV